MTPHDSLDRARTSADSVPPQARRRLAVPPAERIIRQVEAISAWNAARRMRERLPETGCGSRHDAELARRQSDVMRRTQQAIIARAAAELARQVAPMYATTPTAVIAHRHAWFAEKVAALLEQHGVTVVECTDNGPDALGAVVAEQPDIVLSGDRLAMMTADVLLAETRLFSPATARVVQVSDPQQADVWSTDVERVFLRHHPPGDVADALGALCLAPALGHGRL